MLGYLPSFDPHSFSLDPLILPIHPCWSLEMCSSNSIIIWVQLSTVAPFDGILSLRIGDTMKTIKGTEARIWLHAGCYSSIHRFL
ncbi:hypothetical protein LINGRAHAP2_LOCUS32190 [Linum grandiflorum]